MADNELWDKVCMELFGRKNLVDDENDMLMVRATKKVVLDEVVSLLDERNKELNRWVEKARSKKAFGLVNTIECYILAENEEVKKRVVGLI